MPEHATNTNEFKVVAMFHPSHRVTDLVEVESFFERVFGRNSARLNVLSGTEVQNPDNRNDYSTFTTIRDVVFDSIQPSRLIKAGRQLYPDVASSHLNGLGWYIEGMPEAFRAVKAAGFTLVGQDDKVAEGDEPPTVIGAPLPMFWTTREDAGLRYQFVPTIQMPGDVRLKPGWQLAPTSAHDPLGLERCASHTILTDDVDRSRRLFVDTLGGTVIHEGRNEIRGITSTYIHLGDGVYEFAVPDQGSAAHADWASDPSGDVYHAITWKVQDLDKVERHLTEQGVRIDVRTDEMIVTDPATSIGIPWGFSKSLVPGDPRG
jgi:catechol 2,3-dioxygenase-like lactoylglutathione lyase family enzyme